MNSLDTIRLRVPKQELGQTSFFDNGEAAVNAWVAKLPMTNVGQTTRLLFEALTELNTVRLIPSERMAMLELLRTPIYYVSNALSKHFLNQPIALPKKSRKVAALDIEIHQLLATGYLLVATHSIALASSNSKNRTQPQIASALHRVITEHSRNIQRQFQLYEPATSDSWRDLHQFYCLARQQGVLNQVVDDQQFGRCTVEESYIRVLLLGCSKPNQLRQDDLERLFKPATVWASYCALEAGDSNSLFLVDPEGDKPAIYRELHTPPVDPQLIGLNTEKLSEHLSQVRQESDPSKLNITIDDCLISNDLLSHLIVAWSLPANRSLVRLATDGQLEMCVGLSTVHHFLLDGANFELLVDEPGETAYSVHHENRFMAPKSTNPIRQKDVWDSPYEANLRESNPALQSIDLQVRNSKNSSPATVNKYDNYSVTMTNSSDNGYCIEVPDETGAKVKTGEIIGIREAGEDNWTTAVIRWVSHDSDETSQLGIELISANASPFGARIMAKTGGKNDYIRVILLPEIATINQPGTLLTPRFPFRSGQKLTLNQYGKRRQIKLGPKLNMTGAYNQFEIQDVAILRQKIDESSNEDGKFDSLWNQL